MSQAKLIVASSMDDIPRSVTGIPIMKKDWYRECVDTRSYVPIKPTWILDSNGYKSKNNPEKPFVPPSKIDLAKSSEESLVIKKKIKKVLESPKKLKQESEECEDTIPIEPEISKNTIKNVSEEEPVGEVVVTPMIPIKKNRRKSNPHSAAIMPSNNVEAVKKRKTSKNNLDKNEHQNEHQNDLDENESKRRKNEFNQTSQNSKVFVYLSRSADLKDSYTKEINNLADFVVVANVEKASHLVSLEEPPYSRTDAVVVAISKGLWVLKKAWIDMCLNVGYLVDESSFELVDVWKGTKLSRILHSKGSSDLFAGITFKIDGTKSSKDDNYYYRKCKQMILNSGGSISSSPMFANYIIINPTTYHRAFLKTNLALDKDSQEKPIIRSEYIMDCISSWKLLPIESYSLS